MIVFFRNVDSELTCLDAKSTNKQGSPVDGCAGNNLICAIGIFSKLRSSTSSDWISEVELNTVTDAPVFSDRCNTSPFKQPKKIKDEMK